MSLAWEATTTDATVLADEVIVARGSASGRLRGKTLGSRGEIGALSCVQERNILTERSE